MADYNNGSVTVTVTGGVAPYTYTLQELIGSTYVTVPDNEYSSPAWSNPVTVSSTTYTFGNSLGPDQNTTIDFTGVRPGTYKVRIVDGSGDCELLTDPIVVNEFQVGGSNACVTFETVTPSEAPLGWTASATAPTTSANTNGNIEAYVPMNLYNGGFDDTEITVTATLSGGGSFNLPVSGAVIQNSYQFIDSPAELTPGTYTVVATVPSEGCSRSLGTVVVPPFVGGQSIDITGVTITLDGSTVSPTSLVSGTEYTVTINSTSSNLDGAPLFVISVTGTSNYTVSPSVFDTNNVFTLTINDTGSFTLGAYAQDSDTSPNDIFNQSITVGTGGGGATGTTIYYFHGGATAWPYGTGGDLTASATIYYKPDGLGGFATATFDEAMTYVLDNAGTQIADPFGSGGPYTVNELVMPAGATLLDDGTAGNTSWTFPAEVAADKYYLAVPSSVTGFTTDLTTGPYMLNSSNVPTNAVEKKTFTYNGATWTLYKMGAATSANALNYGLNN